MYFYSYILRTDLFRGELGAALVQDKTGHVALSVFIERDLRFDDLQEKLRLGFREHFYLGLSGGLDKNPSVLSNYNVGASPVSRKIGQLLARVK